MLAGRRIMTEEKPKSATQRFEEALSGAQTAKYVLRLYIAGNTGKSSRAIETIREVCEHQLKDRYSLEVIDIYQQPDRARDDQVIVVPTLIKFLPPPLRRIIGDLSSTGRILVGLNLEPIEQAAGSSGDEENDSQSSGGP